MRRFALLSGIHLTLFAFWCLAGADDRASGQGKDPKKEASETIELHLLDKNGGATFGDWNVWRYDLEGASSLFLVNTKTGYAVSLFWQSSGWINYRTDKGEWYVLWSKGAAEKQDRKELKIEPFLKMKPAAALETGKYNFQGVIVDKGKKVTNRWTVKVTKDYIDFRNAGNDDRITIRRNSGEVTHNGRSFGEKE